MYLNYDIFMKIFTIQLIIARKFLHLIDCTQIVDKNKYFFNIRKVYIFGINYLRILCIQISS